MSACTVEALETSVNFAGILLRDPSNAEKNKVAYIASLSTMFSQNKAGDPEFIAKSVEAVLSVSKRARRGIFNKTTMEELEVFINANRLPQSEVQKNLDLLGEGYNTPEGVVAFIREKALRTETEVRDSNINLSNEVVLASEADLEYNVLNDREVAESLSVKNATNYMARKKQQRIDLVEGLKSGSSDMWSAILGVYFPGSNKLGAEFTEWTREQFFSLLVDFTDPTKGFISNIDQVVKEYKKRLQDEAAGLAGLSYGETDTDFLYNLFTKDDVRRKYNISVLLNDFDFILENLIKVIAVDAKKTNFENYTIEGLQVNGRKMEPILASIPRRLRTQAFKNVEGSVNRFVPQDHVTDEVIEVSISSYDLYKKDDLENNTFYHTLADDLYFYKDFKGGIHPLKPVIYYNYNGASDRNTSSIDHDVNPLDNAAKFINNLFPLLKIIDSDGNVGRRMSVSDFITISPLLVETRPSLDELERTLLELANKDATKVAAIARSLHAYIFSTVPTFKNKYNSLRVAGRNNPGNNINKDIVNALHSALVSKDHLRYLKVEEGITIATKGPNKGTESQIIDEALSGYLMDVDRYTKSSIATKFSYEEGKLMIKLGGSRFADLSLVTSMDGSENTSSMRYIARSIGLEDLFNDVTNTYGDVVDAADLDAKVVETFRGIIEVAAANARKPENRLPLSKAVEKSVSRVSVHKDYMYLSPSTIIKTTTQKNLAEVFFVDSSKAQRIGDKTTQSSTTPNRNTHIKRHVEDLKTMQDKKLLPIDMSHIPFILEEAMEGSAILPALVDDVFIKAPIVYDGNVVGVSDWDTKIRLEHSMVEGMLKAPSKKNIGSEFYLQAVNYSDKSSPELIKISVGKNLLSNKAGTKSGLVKAYIEYNYRKNEALQRVTLTSFKEFILGEYSYIANKLRANAAYTGEDVESNIAALNKLKYLLLKTDYTKETGDMTKPVNELLKEVGLTTEMIEQSNADLDSGADYTNIGNNAYLKPTAGIRAELYRDEKKAKKLVNHYLKQSRNLLKNTENKKSLDNFEVDVERIQTILSSTKNVTNDVGDFFDRFFLINGIYGHALKTLTMGDETYFSGKIKPEKRKDGDENLDAIDLFYNNANEDLNSEDSAVLEQAGLDGVDGMITAQFKRAQSILSRGVTYSQRQTLLGIKKKSNRDNLLQHLEVYKDKKEEVVGNEVTYKDVYRFKSLEGNTLTELLGKGVIAPIVEGTTQLSAISYSGNVLVKFKVGNQYLVASSDINEMRKLESEELPIELLEAIADLLSSRDKLAEDLSIDTEMEILADIATTQLLTPSVETYRTNSMTMVDIMEHFRQLEESKEDPVVLPDFIPSILMSDPLSYVNLLNKMDVFQENSDAIQMIHPLYELIREHARGNEIGAFNTKAHNAQKLINTGVETAKNRQSLQKSSTQMHFSMEQMSKLGSVELFNLFKQLNTAIDFKQVRLTYVRDKGGIKNVLDEKLQATRINNLDELFEYFGGYTQKGDDAWFEVFEVLRQNPVNMYSFVGLVNVPSNQKTGRKNITKFEDAFAKEIDKPTVQGDASTGRDFIDTPGNLIIGEDSTEYNFEILSKEHDYDVSGKLNKRSTLALLSQLVNAVSFGGLSDVNAMSLQNAMGGRMQLNRSRVGKDLAMVARAMKRDVEKRKYAEGDYDAVIEKLMTGDVSTETYNNPQKELYEEVIRSGVYSMAQLAFNEKADSILIKKMIEGEGYALDTPAIQAKVMGTLRSAFFTDTVKQKMQGFQAVVSTTFKTINIFDLNNSRKSRVGYFRSGYNLGPEHDWSKEEGRLLVLSEATDQDLEDIDKFVLPFDYVNSAVTITKRDKNGTIISTDTRNKLLRRSSIGEAEYEGYKSKKSKIKEDASIPGGGTVEISRDLHVILTPDVVYTPDIDLKRYNEDLADKPNTLIRVRTGLSSFKTYYKWYYDKITTKEERDAAIARKDVVEDVTEKFSLQWYKITRTLPDGSKEAIEDTKAFRDFYAAVVDSDGKLPEKDLIEYRAALMVETQRKKEIIKDGKTVKANIWDITPAEVVLPSFMRERLGMKEGESMHDYLGDSTSKEEQRLFLNQKLLKTVPRGKRYALLTHNTRQKKKKHYSKMVTRIYASRAIVERSPWFNDIYRYLSTTEAAYIEAEVIAARVRGEELNPHDVELSSAAIKYINDRKNAAFEAHVQKLGDSFMSMLDVVLTRIPGQSKQSGFTANVVEFLDAQGNASFAPTEHLVTTGGDYDIDTLSVLTRTMDTQGMVNDGNAFLDENGVFDYTLLEAKYNKDIAQLSKDVIKYISDYNDESTEYVRHLKNKLDIEKKGENRAAKIAQYEERIVFAKNNIVDKNKTEDIILEIAKGIHEKYENIMSNTIATNIIDALNKVDTSVELNTPVSFSLFPPIIKRIEETYGTPSIMGMNGETYWPIFRYEELASQGKEAVGIYATVLKINSAIQTAAIHYRRYKDKFGRNNELDPFVFKHTIEYYKKDKDGKRIKTIKHRESFADLDRFGVTRKVADSIEIQEKLQSLQSGAEKYEKESVATLFNILQEDISASVTKYLKVKDSFTLEEKQELLFALGEEAGTDTFDEKFIDFIEKGIKKVDDKGILDNEFIQKVSLALGIDAVGSRGDRYTLEGKLERSKLKPTAKNMRIFESIVTNTYGIELTDEIRNSETPFQELKEYLENNPRIVEKAYLNILGKQLSNDIQSQYLSAATDNAKELILGKIRSSPLTNPVITTMMILGYEIDDIIDFLYDPTIEKILISFSKEKSDLKRVSLRPESVEALGNVNAVTKSLISILKVGEEITKFRDIRNLNENAKIEQAILDKILENIDSDPLYTAVIKDEFNRTIPTSSVSPAVKVFNASQMLFLHPQSRALFINLYESEKYKIPALFRTAGEITAQAGKKSRNTLIYKNINSALSALKVESFLGAKKKIDGKNTVIIGEIMHRNEDGTFDTGKVRKVKLDNPINRAEFVKEFPKYIDYARTIIKDNKGLDALAYTNTFRSTHSIFAVPKLKNSNVDPVDAAIIMDGIRKLKNLDTDQQTLEDGAQLNIDELNAFKQRLYNNLSYYALIVSKGEVRRGSMIELFEEIVFKFGEYLNTLDSDYYEKNFRPTNEIVQDIIKGKLPTITALSDAYSANASGTFYDEYSTGDILDNQSDISDDMHQTDIDPMDDGGEYEIGGSSTNNMSYDLSYNTNITKEVVGNPALVNRAFRIVDKNLRDAIFYVANAGEIAYRIFDIVGDQASPNTMNATFNTHSSIPFASELGLAGKQIGYKIKYKGKDAWILNFAGSKLLDGSTFSYDTYQVKVDGTDEILRIPGVYLMNEKGNEDLFLKGNIIEEKNAGNIRNYTKYKEEAEARMAYIPKVVDSKTFVFKVKDVVSAAFTQNELLNDEIISAESKLLFYRAGAVLMPDKLNTSHSKTRSLNVYSDPNNGILTANDAVRNPLIPSVYMSKYSENSSVEGKEIIPELKHKITQSINNLDVDSSITFSGMLRPRTNKLGMKIVGGLDMLEDVLKAYMDPNKKGFLKGAFTLSIVPNAFDETFSYTITRKAPKVYLQRVGDITISTSIGKVSERLVADKTKSPNDQLLAMYKTIDNGYSTTTHSKIKVNLDGTSRDLILFNAGNTNMFGLVKVPGRGFNDKFYKVRKATSKYKGFDDKYLNYYATEEELLNINTIASESEGKPINLKCN